VKFNQSGLYGWFLPYMVKLPQHSQNFCSNPATVYGKEPLVLPMGWTQLPPYFCSATETVVDLTKKGLTNQLKPPPHQLEEAADTSPNEPLNVPLLNAWM
jgi:hypothetical protein